MDTEVIAFVSFDLVGDVESVDLLEVRSVALSQGREFVLRLSLL